MAHPGVKFTTSGENHVRIQDVYACLSLFVVLLLAYGVFWVGMSLFGHKHPPNRPMNV
jgi:hypothetical protein